MIIYRPHRGSLADAMAEAKEFNNEQEMKEYIVKQWNGYIFFFCKESVKPLYSFLRLLNPLSYFLNT